MDNKQKEEQVLGLGTIVRLKQFQQANPENNYLQMIIGHNQINPQTNKVANYVLVTYPYGLATNDLWFCNQEDIVEVRYQGYKSE